MRDVIGFKAAIEHSRHLLLHEQTTYNGYGYSVTLWRGAYGIIPVVQARIAGRWVLVTEPNAVNMLSESVLHSAAVRSMDTTLNERNIRTNDVAFQNFVERSLRIIRGRMLTPDVAAGVAIDDIISEMRGGGSIKISARQQQSRQPSRQQSQQQKSHRGNGGW